jgi:hypothetical protein
MVTLYFGVKIVWALLVAVAAVIGSLLLFVAVVLWLLAAGAVAVGRGVYGALPPAD